MPRPAPVQLPRALIPALMLLAADDGQGRTPVAAVHRLERIGLARHGVISETGRRIVADMTEAALVISIECHTADLPYRSTIWARPEGAIWGRPVDSEVFELRRIEPIELPLLLAQITNVGRRPRPPFSGSVTVPAEPLRALLDHHHDPETAFAILVAAGVAPTWADRLLIAHDNRHVEWTVSSVWTDPVGTHGVHETCILDAGPAGYWHVKRCEESATATYTVGSLESVMHSLRRCVPAWCTARPVSPP